MQEDDNSGLDNNALIATNSLLYRYDRYYVKIKGSNPGVTGSYSIDVNFCTGYTDIFNSTSLSANRQAMPIQINDNYSINSISMYHNGGYGNVLLGVYSFGSPSRLLGVTEITPVNISEGLVLSNLKVQW